MANGNSTRKGPKFSRSAILRVFYATLTFVVLFCLTTLLIFLADIAGLFKLFDGILTLLMCVVAIFCYGWARGFWEIGLAHKQPKPVNSTEE